MIYHKTQYIILCGLLRFYKKIIIIITGNKIILYCISGVTDVGVFLYNIIFVRFRKKK